MLKKKKKTMADTFEFQEWCKEYEINDDTMNALLEKGYNSYRSLRLLTTDDIQKLFSKKVLPAQLSLLQEGVSILQPMAPTSRSAATASNPTSMDSSSPVLPMEASQQATGGSREDRAVNVQELLQMCGLGGPPPTDTGEPLYPTDPYCLGKGPFANKYREVGSHVTSLPTTEEEGTAVTVGGISFTMASERKVKRDKLKMAQYIEGALTILRAMITEDHMPMHRILDYVNYLIQVSRFAQTFAWPAVLNFDAIYRKQQSELGFRWGTSSATLMQTQLRVDPQGTAKAPQHPPNVKDPNTGRTVCQKWNGRRGCTYQNCTFSHVCRVCFSANHRQYQHGEEKTMSTVQTKN